MDHSTFYNITGVPLTPQQRDRFKFVREVAAAELAEALGWPLTPEFWENQYTEIGILPGPDSFDFDFDWDINTMDLLPPDPVVGQLRQFRWFEDDQYLFIDPATAIHAVKLVKDGVTVHTFNPEHYRVQWMNGPTTFTRYIELRPMTVLTRWLLFLWAPLPEVWFGHEHRFVELVIDADWGFTTLPTPIVRAWAEQIAYEYDLKRDIKTETMLGHSYSKDARQTPVTKLLPTYRKYAGPNSNVISPGYLV